MPIFCRTPATMAQTAATIDEHSGGRMVLGLGVSHRVTVENWHGAKIDKPVTQMREYVAAVRAILRGETPPDSERFPTKFAFMGYAARPDLPIYVAALSPNMIRLAGELADGVMLWLCCPAYIATRSYRRFARASSAPGAAARASMSSPRSRSRSPTTPRRRARPCART